MRRVREAAAALGLTLMLLLAGCKPPGTPEGTTSTTSVQATEGSGEAPGRPAEARPAFAGDVAMRHVRHLSEEVGARPAGSAALESACDYVAAALEAAGLEPERLPYTLPDGRATVNVSATRTGKSADEVVLAVHLDTVPGCPGANDDASGVGALLELAALLEDAQPPRSVRFVFFTAEEAIEGFDEHGYSSLKFFEALDAKAVEKMAAACWLDKIGAGPTLKIMHIEGTPASVAQRLNKLAQRWDMKPRLIAAKRWAEEMAFEDRGIPTAWVEYGPAPQLHEPGDDITNVDQTKLAAAGALVHQWLTEEPPG